VRAADLLRRRLAGNIFLAPLISEIWREFKNKNWELLNFPDAPTGQVII